MPRSSIHQFSKVKQSLIFNVDIRRKPPSGLNGTVYFQPGPTAGASTFPVFNLSTASNNYWLQSQLQPGW